MSPHEIADPTTPRSKTPFVVAGVLAAGVAVAATAGLAWRALDPTTEVTGQVALTSEALVRIGPGGWYYESGRRGAPDLVRQVGTDASWEVPEMESGLSATPDLLTEDGTVLLLDGDAVEIRTADGTQRADVRDVAQAYGEDLWPGERLELVGASATHAVVRSCLTDESDGAAQDVTVLAGVALDDGDVSWATRVAASCDPEVATYKARHVPAQRYTFVETPDEVLAVDLSDGDVAQRWRGLEIHDVAVRGDDALVTVGDRVRAISLRSGRTLDEQECRVASLGDDIGIDGQVSELGALSAGCMERSWVWDGEQLVEGPDDGGGINEPLSEGREVARGRLALTREGTTLHVRDLLGERPDQEVAMQSEDAVVAAYQPAGRLLVLAEVGDDHASSMRLVDLQTGDLVADATGRLDFSADVTPDGYALVESADHETHWVVGVAR